jgi:hypothetical protein
MISHVAILPVNITEDVSILNFLTNHIAIIHKPRPVKGENRNDTSNNPNNTKSTNAVIFAKAANQKKSHAIKTYFSTSLFSLDFLF